MKKLFLYILLAYLPLGGWCQTSTNHSLTNHSSNHYQVFDRQDWKDSLTNLGYIDLSEVENIIISDSAYSHIEGAQKKISLEVKTKEDASKTTFYELTDILEEAIGGFREEEGTATATIHYISKEASSLKMLELLARAKNRDRDITDYREDIYIIDLVGEKNKPQIFTFFTFSDAFRDRFHESDNAEESPPRLGKWTKYLLFNDLKKLVASTSSKNEWASVIDVIASYSMSGLSEYWMTESLDCTTALYSILLKEGFTGFIADVVTGYRKHISANLIEIIIARILHAKQVGVVCGLPIFNQKLLDHPSLAEAFLRSKKLLKASKKLHPSPYTKNLGALELFSDSLVLASYERVLTTGIADQHPDIPIAELSIIHHYTTDAYRDLNRILRKGNNFRYYQAFEKMLNNGLLKLPNYTDISYRGLALPIHIVLSKYKYAYDNQFPFVREAHFTSTTKDLNVAEEYLHTKVDNLSPTLNPDTPNKSVKTMFYFAAGSAKDIEFISFYGPNGPIDFNEQEALFKSNSKFSIINFKQDRVDDNGNVIVEIYLKEINIENP